MHSGESNYSSLSNYFISAKKRKREWNNGILKFVYLYIYIYIFKKSTLVEDYFTSQTKVFQGCETLPSSIQKKKVVKLGPYGQTRLTKNCSPKRFFSPQKPVYMKNSMNCANRGSTSRIWKPWTVVVLPGSVDLEFFFFLGTYRLNHWWSFNLRHWDRNTICSYSSFQSRSHSLFAFFADCYFCIFSFSAFFSFVVSAIFCLLVFFLWSLESSGLFEDDWQFMSLIKTIPNFLNYGKQQK